MSSSVSVIIPVHNGQRFILEALASVREQTRPPDEIVVVDDGSSDATAELVGSWPEKVRYLRQQQQGPAAARNAGLATASGERIAFLDCDDLWCPGHLERTQACLDAEPTVQIAQGLIQRMQWRDGGFHNDLGPYQFVNLGSLVVRRQVFEEVGDFAPELRENEDIDWVMRAWEHSIEKRLLPQVSLYYRLHDSNMVHQQQLHAGGVNV